MRLCRYDGWVGYTGVLYEESSLGQQLRSSTVEPYSYDVTA